MNSDIRLSVSFLDHFKTHRLIRESGFGAVLALIRLWFWTAQNRPDGNLGKLTDDELDYITRWPDYAEGNALDMLTASGWLDGPPPDGPFIVHGWSEHQPWVINAKQRSLAAKKAAMARWNADGMRAACAPHKTAYAPLLSSPSPTSPKTQSRAKRSSAGPPPGFVHWWETYPRKVAKQAALKAWKRLKLEPEAERIIAATVAHAKSEQWRRDGGQYVPNPLTYLNQGRYDDPPPDQQTSNVTPFKNYLLDEDGA